VPYLILAACGAVFALGTTPLVARLARRLGALDQPADHRVHAHAIPRLGGLAILAGYQAKLAALLLAGFTLMAALIFHSDFSQPMQSILFSKNLAIAGGFLILFAHGAGDWTISAPARPGPDIKT